MNITVTLNGSLEEITVALNAIEAHKRRSESILPIRTMPEAKVTIPDEPKKKAKVWGQWKKAVDIYIWSVESWFAYHKTFESVTAVANYLHLSHPAVVSPYLKSGDIYKKIYKFKYHDRPSRA